MAMTRSVPARLAKGCRCPAAAAGGQLVEQIRHIYRFATLCVLGQLLKPYKRLRPEAPACDFKTYLRQESSLAPSGATSADI